MKEHEEETEVSLKNCGTKDTQKSKESTKIMG